MDPYHRTKHRGEQKKHRRNESSKGHKRPICWFDFVRCLRVFISPFRDPASRARFKVVLSYSIRYPKKDDVISHRTKVIITDSNIEVKYFFEQMFVSRWPLFLTASECLCMMFLCRQGHCKNTVICLDHHRPSPKLLEVRRCNRYDRKVSLLAELRCYFKCLFAQPSIEVYRQALSSHSEPRKDYVFWNTGIITATVA